MHCRRFRLRGCVETVAAGAEACRGGTASGRLGTCTAGAGDTVIAKLGEIVGWEK